MEILSSSAVNVLFSPIMKSNIMPKTLVFIDSRVNDFELFFCGCKVGAGADWHEFVEIFSHITGADEQFVILLK
ncbi:MAG: hypothetical protein WBP54_05775 [Pelodictyon phaeoclathratiforme]